MASPSFSFDWNGSRGAGYLSAWNAYGEGLPYVSASRWKHFAALLLLSALLFLMAGLFLPLLLLRPQKFCFFFTMGSLTAMLAFAVLRGPVEQLRHMFSIQRLPFTATYVGSMVLTLYAAFGLRSHILVILFSVVQACALAWYLLSYIPGGAPILKMFTRTFAAAVQALCCRRRGALLPL